MTLWLCIALLLGSPAAAVPLAEAHRAQAETFVDGGHPDQPALYALLADVAAWDAEAAGRADSAGARWPDWDALRDDPAAWRGEAVVLEGAYAGRQRRWPVTRRDPRWGEALTEWGLIVGDDPVAVRADPAARVRDGGAWPVVVLFVDADAALAPPPAGAGVRIVARFLGWWDDTDEAAAAQRYPVFVARSAEVLPARSGQTGWTGPLIAGLLVVTTLAIVWRLRAAGNGPDFWEQRRRRRRLQRRHAGLATPDESPGPHDLPSAPDAALARLREPDP